MKEYIDKNFEQVSQKLLKRTTENFKVFYESELNYSFEITGYMTSGEDVYVQIKSTGNFHIIKPGEKIYILRN